MRAAVLLTLSAALLLLAACGGGGSQPPPTPSGSPAAALTAAPASTLEIAYVEPNSNDIWLMAAALPGGGAVYICGATSAIPAYFHAFAAADLHFSSMIIWNKGSFAFSRKDYHPQFELIWYGWPQGKPHYFGGGRSQSDIWEIHREDGHSYLHPTQKPVELVQRAIQNSARPGQTVLDVFLGSGTTVIASEKSGRRCLGLEIDALFCEVALARWERLTRERARRAD
jgi:DNA modification methylase